MNYKNLGNLIFVLSILLGVSLGCLGPSADDYKCEGIVKSNGKTYVGGSKTEEQAGLNACNKFCLENDEYEALYGIWLDSDKAKTLEKSRGKKISKEDAIYEDKNLMDFVTKTCAPKCKAEANKGKHTLETSCK